jgi:hypothetical protein
MESCLAETAARAAGAGYVEDIIARTDAACLIDIHLKHTSYQEALHSGRLPLEGPASSGTPS